MALYIRTHVPPQDMPPAGPTLRFMAVCLAIAAGLVAPTLGRAAGAPWAIDTFPLSWLLGGLDAAGIFVHEIGHAIFGWLFGYATLPMFDFVHGGGLAVHFGGRSWALFWAVCAALAWGLVRWRAYPLLAVPLALALGVQLTFGFTDAHEVVVLFMGHGFEVVVAALLLARAWLDIAPRGWLERGLNGVIGFGMLGSLAIFCWGLAHDWVQREMYASSKCGLHMGDFSRIAEHTGTSVEAVALLCLVWAFVGLLVPVVLWAWMRCAGVQITRGAA